MTRWAKGESAIEELLAADQLQSVRGAQADGSPLLDRARNAINSAASISGRDPDSAFTLAYDAARFACTALLAQQGLRPTVKGGHLVVERVVRAQFGDTFRRFRDLRIRRHEIEYPDHPTNASTNGRHSKRSPMPTSSSMRPPGSSTTSACSSRGRWWHQLGGSRPGRLRQVFQGGPATARLDEHRRGRPRRPTEGLRCHRSGHDGIPGDINFQVTGSQRAVTTRRGETAAKAADGDANSKWVNFHPTGGPT